MARRSGDRPVLGSVNPLLLDSQATRRVRVRRWAMQRPSPRWPVAAHAGAEVSCVLRGTVSLRVGSRRLEVGAGEAFVVPAEHEHETTIAPGTEATTLWLERGFVDEVAGLVERGGRRALEATALDARGLASLTDLILDEAQRRAAGSFASIDALAEALTIRVLRAVPEQDHATGSDPRIRRAVDEIQARFADRLSIDDLARTATMSRYHFSRQFRAEVGQSPYQYLVATRVRRAAELLRKRRCSVTEAAFEVGFTDASRFARAFRRHLGCAPSAYA